MTKVILTLGDSYEVYIYFEGHLKKSEVHHLLVKYFEQKNYDSIWFYQIEHK